ncbi:hypothetical protein [Actinomadura chokoriensis]|uniref:YncE family protein n=1 Tax=Actinomadura chokoriensis TaxID=454156 RepID=A0ABV4R649_9ACTN
MRARPRAAALPFAAALTMAPGVLAGCTSPVPFHRPGKPSPDDPVVGLGGPAPYLRARPDAKRPPSAPGPPAGGPVYAGTGPGMIAPHARKLPPRIYVANGRLIDVVDPGAVRVALRFSTGAAASRVVPSWDLRRLWAVDREHDLLVPVRPRGGEPGRPVSVAGLTGLYFTPDGRDALVLAHRRVDVRDPRTMALRASVPMPCSAGHADFSSAGTSMIATCTGAGTLARVDLTGRRAARAIPLPDGARPGDLRLSPDGAVFYVADAARGGVWLVDARRSAPPGFVPAAPGARGLAISRNARLLFVVGGGSVAAVDFRTRRVASRWPLPGGGSPVPGGVSSDGTALWLADPAGLVYAVSTRTGRVVRRIWVGGRPSGLCVHPQPGRYSLGGTGLYR